MMKRFALLIGLLVFPLSEAHAKDDSWFQSSKQWVQQLWQSDAQDWLEHINFAVLNNNYSGVIVVAQGQRMESLSVEHKMQNGVESLHMKTLSGTSRELLKQGGKIKINALPKQNKLSATAVTSQTTFSQFASAAENKSYRVSLAEMSRIAGRDTQVVDIKAKDNLRYSYRLWLDTETGLPLKVMTVDINNNTIEQVAFTQITITPVDKISKPENNQAKKALKNPYKDVKGFKLLAIEGRGGSEHYLYSDGLVGVSLYIDASKQKEQAQMSKDSVNGLILGNGRTRVVALGKVPMVTLEEFLLATQQQ
jgi:sigma-E factor negative regulatory protein RseB